MPKRRTLPYLLSIVAALGVLGAHFYRSGDVAPLLVAIVLIGLLFVRAPWAARIVQV